MVLDYSGKKEMLDDMKKFNQELNKHLPEVEADFFKENLNLFNQNEDNEEYFSLLSRNIIELRTEMNLLRKNFSVDIESMILRQITDYQKNFIRDIKSIQNKNSIEFSENISTLISEFSEEINKLKKDLNELKNPFQEIIQLSGEIKELKEEIKEIKNFVKKENSEMFTKIVLKLNRSFNHEENLKIENKNTKENHIIEHKKIPEVKIESEEIHIQNKIPKKEKISDNFMKILEIEKRIEKLNSLR